MSRISQVLVCIFREDDDMSREERLLRSANHYFGTEAGNALPAEASSWEEQEQHVKKDLLQVEKTPLGKPFFPKMEQLYLSISHSGAYWVCALAPMEVGVDIQEHTMNRSETRQEATARFAKMARRFFHSVEAKFVEEESFYRFFGVWAARESYVKYTGQGIDATFSEHCVIPKREEEWPEQGNALTGPLDGMYWKAQGAYFWEAVFEENYTLCVCTGEALPCRVIRCF